MSDVEKKGDAEKANPVVMLDLEGKEYKLKYNMKAFELIHKIAGVNLVTDKLNVLLNPAALIRIVWGGLLKFHPEFRGDVEDSTHYDENVKKALDTIGDMIDLDNSDNVIEAVLRALGHATPDRKKKEEASPKEAAGAEK